MSEGEFDRLSTGVPGIDEVLGGGLIPRRGYMIRGAPGSGKTILGLHYLTEGTANGESALFVNLEEDEEDVRRNAASLGFDLEGIEFLDLSPGSDTFVEGGGYTVFDPGEVEGEAISGAIADRVDEVEPDRVFVDPMTRLRHLAPDQYQFRKQATGFVRYTLGEKDP